ncbi:N-acetylglucosamine-6-phosphate deacetylase [Cohaesibacter sp. ES.047]|uniref:N-acetylglucosamine-6-phosphate deacetylase n=1 Tax=Cohaesibacter sp. ES.047 TaxID=1798205 RepID=UPI000BC00BC4|nr:N-acetylglucosamine-6-phosphate deacetylase [Cohaesibacter sp. ES.047]SNY90288.1 N-acetylglucosamine-6-phosphate deacetylase [Cohaesibacter sp. ES.047]
MSNKSEFVIEATTLYPGFSAPAVNERAILIKDGLIEAIGERGTFSSRRCIEVDIVAPGFIDIQINGAGDCQFNDTPDASSLAAMARAASAGGVAHIMPTFITESGRAYSAAIDAVEKAISEPIDGVLGLHLEGPFISPEKPGIHRADAIRPLEDSDMALLERTVSYPRIITLAPEETNSETIARLSKAGWRVFVGHSAAGYDLLRDLSSAGLAGATHLFNAMPPLMGREPGPIGAVIEGLLPFAGLIADGMHVHPANLRFAFDHIGPERICLVTDAMLTLGGTTTEFDFGEKRVYLKDGRLCDETGRLGGAHLYLDEAVRNMIRYAGAPVEAAMAMAGSTPALALGVADELGRVASGYRASLTLCDSGLRVLATLSDGEFLYQDTSNQFAKET